MSSYIRRLSSDYIEVQVSSKFRITPQIVNKVKKSLRKVDQVFTDGLDEALSETVAQLEYDHRLLKTWVSVYT